jgi:hypothetical protein
MAEKMNTYRLLVGKAEGNRSLRRPRRRWMDNIKMDLVKIGWGGVDWLGLARVESFCERFSELSGVIKCWETMEWLYNWWAFE